MTPGMGAYGGAYGAGRLLPGLQAQSFASFSADYLQAIVVIDEAACQCIERSVTAASKDNPFALKTGSLVQGFPL